MQSSIQTAIHKAPGVCTEDVNRASAIRDRGPGGAVGIDLDAPNDKEIRILANTAFARHALHARPCIYQLACRLLGNPTEAEDIAQETFVRAWTHYHTFNANCSFDAWVYRIAVNLCVDLKRRQIRCPNVSLDGASPVGAGEDRMELADTTFDPVRHLLNLEINERLTTEMRALPAAYRECVLLLADGYSYRQLANTMNCSLGTIRSRVHRARVQLRRALNSK